MKWQPIKTAPASGPFLAAVKSSHKSGAEYWLRHIISIDAETGAINSDDWQGFELEEYSYWMMLPPMPESQADITKWLEVDLIAAVLILQESLGQAIDELKTLDQHKIAEHLLHALEYAQKKSGVR